ncbi:MAG: hypothetical protein NT010_06815, partial [Proteobacteria bacterium]|nr:hypothetical protein [Pseudomonadota bacterium]
MRMFQTEMNCPAFSCRVNRYDGLREDKALPPGGVPLRCIEYCAVPQSTKQGAKYPSSGHRRIQPLIHKTTYTWGYGHQLLTRTNPAGNVTYTRNPLGQPTQVVNSAPSMIYAYAYDANHRLESVADSRGSKTLSYSYSPGGLLNRMSDSDGNRTDYKYDPVGRLSGIYAPNNDYVAFRYDDGGRLAEKWLSNGVNTQYTYNPDNSLARVVNLTSSSSVISQHDYTYDPFGNRQTHTEQIGSTNTPYKYIYDALNRLTEVWNNSNNTLKERYSYDPLGNRKTKTDGTNIVYYVYDAANQLTQITGNENATLLYDDNGNMYRKTQG